MGNALSLLGHMEVPQTVLTNISSQLLSYSLHKKANFQEEEVNRGKKDTWDKCSGLVHWEDPEGLDGEGGGREDQDGEYM